MLLNWTSVWKVMTIWISREHPLFNFERVNILCARIGHPCEKWWPIEFLENFRFLISSVLIYYNPESDLSLKSYDHLNFSRASVVPFRAPLYVMRLNRTSELKFLTIRISQELPLFNFERLDMWFAIIGHPGEKLGPFEFLESFWCLISSVIIYYKLQSDLGVKSYEHLHFSRASIFQFRTSRYIMRPNRTSVWKIMTNRISRELPLFIFESLYIGCAWIGHLS